ncbi:MAG: hypothetical protein ABIZ36_13630 [Gemmatimonadaceae bacterium]
MCQNRYVARRILSGIDIDRLRMKTPAIAWGVGLATLLCLYSLVAIVFFVVPVRHNFGDVLLGTGTYRHDAVLNAGILEWGFRSIWTPNMHFFDWPPGFPLKGTLAATENLAGWQIIYTPLRAAGITVAASYNAALLASLAVSGVGCSLLASRLGSSQLGAAIGGIIFAFNPFHVDHMIHLQTMAVCWSPFALLGLDMALENRSLRGLLVLAVSLVMTVLSGMYFGVFLVFILPAYAGLCWVTGRYGFSLKTAASIGLTCGVCVLALLPVIAPYFRYAGLYGDYPHSRAEVSLSALSLRSLLQVPVWLGSWNASVLATSGTGGFASAFPGIVTLMLAVAGVMEIRSGSVGKRNVIVLAILAVSCLVLALGPTLLLRHADPLRLTRAVPLPGEIFAHLSAIRWPMRIYMYSVLCLAVMASLGATRVLEFTAGGRRSVIAIGIFVALLAELRPSAWYVRQSTQLSNPIQTSDAYQFLYAEKNRGGVVELPIKMDSGLVTPFATRYAFGSSGHLRGVVAFHGSMSPPLLDSLRLASLDLPKPVAMDMMRNHGVTRLVIHRNLMSADSSRSLTTAIQSQGFPIVFLSPTSTIFSLER